MDLVSFSHSPLSLVAPVVAILLAIITRKVLWSMGAGIIAGALLLTSFNPLDAITYVGKGLFAVFWDDGLNVDSVFYSFLSAPV